jgi:hypothetical protein
MTAQPSTGPAGELDDTLASEVVEAPDLAATAAAHPAVFAGLVQAWADPITDLAPLPERSGRRDAERVLELPDAPSVTTNRPMRQYREPGALFDEDAPDEDLDWRRPT